MAGTSPQNPPSSASCTITVSFILQSVCPRNHRYFRRVLKGAISEKNVIPESPSPSSLLVAASALAWLAAVITSVTNEGEVMARISGELSVGEASATMREIITRLHGSRGPYSLAFAFILVVCAGLGGIIWSSQQMLGIGAGALFVPQRSFQTKAQEQ